MASTTEYNAPLPEVSGIERTTREVNGVDLHVVAAGESTAPLVVLLHGFPEFWYEWHRYIGPLVEAGYRVVVPDQRGYNRSDKPDGAGAYRISELSADILDLIASEGRDSAHVVGHDWGAAVAWDLALRHPSAVDRLGIVNVPHPTVFERVLRSNLAQMRKSWYMLFFQVPAIPEWVVRRDDFDFIVTAMQEGSNPGTFSERDFEVYRRAWAEPGALTAMLDWYRALVRHREDPPREVVSAPTLVLWGDDDQALIPELASRSIEYCEDGHLERFPDATHWVPHETPDRIVALLRSHLE